MEKILGKSAKFVAKLGLTAGAAAATGPLAVAAAGIGGAAAGFVAEEIFGQIAGQAGKLAKYLSSAVSQRQVSDDARTGLDLYYDLDDEYEALLQNMDSKLAKKFQKHFYDYLARAFGQMGGAAGDEPLSDYLEMSANQYFERFLFKKKLSGVGVVVKTRG